ncbi:restriction endonuclease subunit S [candidate division TA06 bacterium]|nr:restriction endonuclease subunit S [candidate division TA06 bacterium]
MTETLGRAVVVWWHDLDRWVVPSAAILSHHLPVGWRRTRLGDVVKLVSNAVKVEPSAEYKMAGVRLYGEGVFHRETVRGNEMSAHWISPLIPGALIYNRLFAWRASFAIVPPNLSGCYVSTEFPQFVPDPTRLMPEYLYLWCLTVQTLRAVNAASTGSAAVSRNRFREGFFLDFEMQLPPLPLQHKIVDTWKEARQAAASILVKTEQLERDIEAEFLDAIGIRVGLASPARGALVIPWSKLERWDLFYYRSDFITLEQCLNSIATAALGSVLRFESRGWQRSDFPQGIFRYVEISNVNKADGIVNSRLVSVEEVPSRATTLLHTGDLIISTTRPYLGAIAIVPGEYDHCVCSSGFALCTGSKGDKLLLQFVLEFLKSPAGLKQMERRMTGGLYPAITQDELEQIRIPVPPLSTQRQILERIGKRREKINTLKAEAKRRSEAAKEDVEAMILGVK